MYDMNPTAVTASKVKAGAIVAKALFASSYSSQKINPERGTPYSE